MRTRRAQQRSTRTRRVGRARRRGAARARGAPRLVRGVPARARRAASTPPRCSPTPPRPPRRARTLRARLLERVRELGPLRCSGRAQRRARLPTRRARPTRPQGRARAETVAERFKRGRSHRQWVAYGALAASLVLAALRSPRSGARTLLCAASWRRRGAERRSGAAGDARSVGARIPRASEELRRRVRGTARLRPARAWRGSRGRRTRRRARASFAYDRDTGRAAPHRLGAAARARGQGLSALVHRRRQASPARPRLQTPTPTGRGLAERHASRPRGATRTPSPSRSNPKPASPRRRAALPRSARPR